MRRHSSGDGWGRGSYDIPDLAVAGCSFCGNSPDSPANEKDVRRELEMVRAELESHGIATQPRYQGTSSGNVCMMKVWLCIDTYLPCCLDEAHRIVAAWLAAHQDTYLVHDAKD